MTRPAYPKNVTRPCLPGLCLLAAACAVGPDYAPPELVVPDAWHSGLQADIAEDGGPLQQWWTLLGDPALQKLVETTAEGSLDLRIAWQRVREAQALRGVAAADRWPDLQGQGSASVGEASARAGAGGGSYHSYQLGVGATWEIDVWGRVARLVENAEAGLQAEVEGYRDVLVVLFAQVGIEYVGFRSLESRIRIAEANVALQRETLELTEGRFRAGLVSELDVRQAQLNLERTRSAIPPLRTGAALASFRLAVLSGLNPGDVAEILATGAPWPLALPDKVHVQGPIDALRRRPDVRQAERALAAQTARIGIAEADLYPQFTLAGSFALEGVDGNAGDFFTSDATAWGIGPRFRWSLFEGGRVQSRIEAERARTEQALAAYRQSVLLALEEIEGALVAFHQERERSAALAQSVVAAEGSVQLVTELYRTGRVDFQNVLDMQRSLAAQQDALAESQGLVLQGLVRLYKAFGGGWSPDVAAAPDDVGVAPAVGGSRPQ